MDSRTEGCQVRSRMPGTSQEKKEGPGESGKGGDAQAPKRQTV